MLMRSHFNANQLLVANRLETKSVHRRFPWLLENRVSAGVPAVGMRAEPAAAHFKLHD